MVQYPFSLKLPHNLKKKQSNQIRGYRDPKRRIDSQIKISKNIKDTKSSNLYKNLHDVKILTFLTNYL